MVNLLVFAEGKTEQVFADTLIRPHLRVYSVYVKTQLVSSCKKKQQIFRGGGKSYDAMKNDLQNSLKQHAGNDEFFTTMIDLFALYKEFPGLEESRKLNDPYARVRLLEQEFATDIGDRRFIPHLQLHEFEAYLFSDVARGLGKVYDDPKKIVLLQAVAEKYKNPELINDQTAPSKQIIAQFPEYDRGKAADGPTAATFIGLPTIRSKCPHFHEWLERLEALKPL